MRSPFSRVVGGTGMIWLSERCTGARDGLRRASCLAFNPHPVSRSGRHDSSCQSAGGQRAWHKSVNDAAPDRAVSDKALAVRCNIANAVADVLDAASTRASTTKPQGRGWISGPLSDCVGDRSPERSAQIGCLAERDGHAFARLATCGWLDAVRTRSGHTSDALAGAAVFQWSGRSGLQASDRARDRAGALRPPRRGSVSVHRREVQQRIVNARRVHGTRACARARRSRRSGWVRRGLPLAPAVRSFRRRPRVRSGRRP